ncbi:putative broad-Complex, Tramtrack and Bric a brac [Lyophyllum shimeji]|uniref:Broad-Complex, Tramtrack and Bric a brac n=1 Tax=Lyophyllum shimeji TaxID=47721 RepID=A0A9P3URH5_LYOSH|nr:putative broad-Complex, Tramtrack and Bric a brac [Lyophyllum shimeji]
MAISALRDRGSLRPKPSRDSDKYIDDHMAVFLVENTLFRAHRYFLIKKPASFRDMFLCPPPPNEPEGGDDQRPITMPSVLCREFRSLLDFSTMGPYLPSSHPGDSKIVSNQDGPKTRRCTGANAHRAGGLGHPPTMDSSTIDIHPMRSPASSPRKSVYAQEYDIPHWRATAFEALCRRNHPSLAAARPRTDFMQRAESCASSSTTAT